MRNQLYALSTETLTSNFVFNSRPDRSPKSCRFGAEWEESRMEALHGVGNDRGSVNMCRITGYWKRTSGSKLHYIGWLQAAAALGMLLDDWPSFVIFFSLLFFFIDIDIITTLFVGSTFLPAWTLNSRPPADRSPPRSIDVNTISLRFLGVVYHFPLAHIHDSRREYFSVRLVCVRNPY